MAEISTLAERARQFRAQAREARFKAAQCHGPIQASFIKMAGQWEQMAIEAEDQIKAEAEKPSKPNGSG